MIPTDKSEFAQLLFTLAQSYQRLWSQSFLAIYWYCLKDYSLSEIKSAFLIYIQQTDGTRWMPQPSDILRILTGAHPTQTAFSAWIKVREAIRRIGSYQSIVFDDFRIHAVIQTLGNWIALGQKTEQELDYVGPEFQKLYCHYLQHRSCQYPSHLIGLLEHQNQIDQQPIPEPLLWGQKTAALMTYLEGVKPVCDNLLQSARSAHQLALEVLKNITSSHVKTESLTEFLDQLDSFSFTKDPYESE